MPTRQTDHGLSEKQLKEFAALTPDFLEGVTGLELNRFTSVNFMTTTTTTTTTAETSLALDKYKT